MDSLKKETRLLKMFKRMNIKNKKCVEECAFISWSMSQEDNGLRVY